MELNFLYIIPCVFFCTVFGQGDVIFSRTSPHTAKTEEGFFVSCTLPDNVASPSTATFQWFDQRGNEVTSTSYLDHLYIKELTNGGLQLFFDNVVDDDGGDYKCKANANGNPYEGDFVLRIRASITFRDCEAKQFGVLGRRADVKCIASAGGAKVDSEWALDGYKLDTNSGNETSDEKYAFQATHMTILNVTKADAGLYRYTAITSGDDAEFDNKDIEFSVYVAPVIVSPILATTAVVGNEAVMYCKASGEPLPSIMWYKINRDGNSEFIGQTSSDSTDRITIAEQNEGGLKQGILTITSVIKEDQSEYMCRASNEANVLDNLDEVEARAYLTVQTPPTISPIGDVKGTEKSSAQLVCEARGDPIPQIIWQKVGSNVQYTAGSSGEDIAANGEQLNDDPNNPGARLTLTISNLKSSNGGNYFCNATNNAGVTSQTVHLEVRFSPNFEAQKETEFYNWAGYTDGVIDCVTDGNPLPVFKWYKGTEVITDATQFYGLSRVESTDPKYPYRVTSKLAVSYNGGNEQVFGDYKCEATNIIQDNSITLTLTKAKAPGEPSVTIEDEGATQIKFRVDGPTVQGPEVSLYKITYVKEGGQEPEKELVVEKNDRDYIDEGRRYTEVYVEQLQSDTGYIFTFFAKNDVGYGPGRELKIRTDVIREPDVVSITTDHNVNTPTIINLRWDRPKDGGSDILYYKISYQQVQVKNQSSDPTKGYERENVLADQMDIQDRIQDEHYVIRNLVPGQYYEVKVRAINGEGPGLPGTKIIRTKPAENMGETSTGSQSGLSTGAIIGIVVGVFIILFIVVDVTCYFKNNCGILMSIKEKVGSGHGEDGYSAAKTDDVENLAKKDELTEEAKAVEEGEVVAAEDEKKELLLSEEQKVDNIDEVETKPENKELTPEDKEEAKPDPPKPETPKIEEPAPTPPAPLEAPSQETPAVQEEQPASTPEKTQE